MRVNLNLPLAWQEKLITLARSRDRDPDDLLLEAIAQYLGVPVPQQEQRLQKVETELVNLKQELQNLQRLFTQTPMTARSATTDEHRTRVEVPPDDNWVDDEPDEILTDFLSPE